MTIIRVDVTNIDKEHICCSISDKKDDSAVSAKKAWLKEAFKRGLVFRKLDERGKVFIEYIPATNAWVPINAENYMYINCLWVSGKFKGHGYADKLLNACIDDAKKQGMNGIVALSSKKKKPFLSDPDFYKYKGFIVADAAEPFFELLYLPFAKSATVPSFKPCAKKNEIDKKEIVIYYSNQCPFAEKYASLLKTLADKKGVRLELSKFINVQEAQNAPTPFTSYAFFFNGKFVTNEIFSEKKFEKFILDNLK